MYSLCKLVFFTCFLLNLIYLFLCSEFLFVHLWHAAASVPCYMSSDWIHHGLEDEGVYRGEDHPPKHREEVHASSQDSFTALESTISIIDR